MVGVLRLLFTNPWVLLLIVALAGFVYVERLAYGEKRYSAGYDAALADKALETAQANEKVRNQRKVQKHENQNLERDAIVAEHCRRGWVREPAQCRNRASR